MQSMLSCLTLYLSLSLGQQPPAPAPPKPAPPGKPATIKVDTVKKGRPGRYLPLKAVTEGKICLWIPVDSGLEFLPAEIAPQDTKVNAALADLPGKYRFLVVTSVNDLPVVAEAAVTFDGKPNPGPGPPSPPPMPTALTAKLQAAYTTDPDSPGVKAGHKVLLVGLYEAMVDHAAGAALLTTGDLLGDLKTVAGKMIAAGALVDVRRVISAEIADALGTDPAARLDPALRPAAVRVFGRIAACLKEVK